MSSNYVSGKQDGTNAPGLSSSTSHAINDAEVVVGHMANKIPLPSELMDSVESGVDQSIISFLAKPQIITYGTLASTDTTASPLYTNIIPQGIIHSNSIWADKLKGLYAFKGDLVLTLQVNSNRFQAGRYILAWIPSGGGSIDSNHIANFRTMHSFSLTQITQLPHVELDINTDTEATLMIPHTTAQSFATIDPTKTSNYFGNNGSVILVPYSPLVAVAGSTTATYSIFGHWENVRFAMPVVPQSGRVKTFVKRKVTPTSAEQASAGIGPIEGTMRKITKAAGIVNSVPYLSLVAAPVAWASDLAAQVASVFGWSKPRHLDPETLIARYLTQRYTNSDTADNSVKLSITDKNEVELLPGFAGSNLDEMSISYIATIPAFYYNKTWSTSDAENTSLFQIFLSPRDLYTANVVGGNTYYNMTPVTYLSSFFGLYRGSLKFTLKFVKTEFHSGRLLLTFHPLEYQTNPTPPTPTVSTSAYVHREIIDVRLVNEYTFTVPYLSISQYRSTYANDRGYGYVEIQVLNPLVAPATVSSTLTMLIEVSAGDDFELAMPVDPSWDPVAPLFPQSGLNVCQEAELTFGNGVTYSSDTPSKFCIGEKITSLAQLAKRFSKLYFVTDTVENQFLNILPYGIPVQQVAAAAPVTTTVVADMFSRIGVCFGLYRGSVRYKFLTTDSSPNSLFVASWDALTSGSAIKNTLAFSTANNNGSAIVMPINRPSQLYDPKLNGGVEVEYPFYSRYHSIAVADMLNCTNSASPTDIAYRCSATAVRLAGTIHTDWDGSTVTPVNPPISMRAMGEDSHFGLFISVPPVLNYLFYAQ